MRTEDGWLGYAHSRFGRGDYYVCVRVTKDERALMEEYIDAHNTGMRHLPSTVLSSIAMKEIRKWKRDSSTQTVKTEEEK